MLIRQAITSLSQRQTAIYGKLGINFLFHTTVSTTTLEDDDEPKVKPRTLKPWRKELKIEPSHLKMLEIPTPPRKKFTVPRRRLKLAPVEIKRWIKGQKVNYMKADQKFVDDRHRILGCDLAAAHFLVYRGGKIRFKGQTDWIAADEYGTYNLPVFYDPTLHISDLNASGVHLYNEGLDNFVNLVRVKWASFKGNKFFDDWSVDKVSAQFPNAEYLDISECPQVTERGLEALYRMYSLKTLVITNWNNLPSFELTCAMLEDCNPELTIKIMEPGKKVEDN